MTKTQSKLQLDTLFTWATLVVILIYLTVFFLIKPYIGFGYTSEGVINEIFNKDKKSCSPELTKDDQIETFQGVAWEQISEPFQSVFQDVESDTTISLTLRGRDGPISCPVLVWESQEFIQRVNSLWWLALVFWLAGAMSVWFVRPKDGLRRALIAVSFFTAIWIAAGHASPTGLVYSRSILRAILWLSVAAFVDFHWRFPRPVYPLPTIVSGLWYGAAGVLAVGEWFGWRLIGDSEAILGGCFAVVFGLIVIRFVTQPQERSALSPLMGAFVVCVVPVMIILVVDVAGWALPSLAQGMALLGLPAVPGAYFWAVYRYQMRGWTKQIARLFRFYLGLLVALVFVAVVGGWWGIQEGLDENSGLFVGFLLIIFELGIVLAGFLPLLFVAVIAQNDESMLRPGITFRANRQATNAIFFVLVLTLIAIPLTLCLLWFNQKPLSKLAVIIGVTLTYWVVTSYRTRFNRWIESRLLGIPVPPAGLLEIYSAHLPTILTHAELSDYLTRRILPSILVRQSALYYLDEMSHLVLLYQQNLQPTELLSPVLAPYLIDQPEQVATVSNLAWVKVALPLRLGNKTSGLWLFGRRDPDDRYAQAEMSLFQSLANQTAIGLESIIQTNRLRAIYQANINQQDAERYRLSRELHDQVMNDLPTILLNLDDSSYTPKFGAAYQLVSNKLRQVIHDLRPATLNYGLYLALEQLADDLNERANNQPEIVVKLPAGDTRYPPEVEQHLFCIAQEACRNAIRHAQANHIEISGTLLPTRISLQVKDTGRGLPNPTFDLANLLANKHYGLVGMYERANIIQATLRIESAPGQGTTIHLDWSDNSATSNNQMESSPAPTL